MSGVVAYGASPAPRDPAALARAILAQPRFHLHAAAPPARTWWDIVTVWLHDRWAQLMDEFSRHVRLSSGASVALGDILLIALIMLVVLVVARLLLNMAREHAQPGSGSAVALAAHADARALYAAAREAAAQTAYGPAIALLFRAALASLDARGVLRDDPARTVNECRADVRRNAAGWSAPFDVIARAFTMAVYAEHRVSAEDWAAAQRAFERFLQPQTDAA